MPPRVVIASDSFTGSLSSLDVADAVRLGLLDVAPTALVAVVAVADGGEGTVAAALDAGWEGALFEVPGPTGAHPLDLESEPARSRAGAPDLLRRTARRIAQGWLSPAPG